MPTSSNQCTKQSKDHGFGECPATEVDDPNPTTKNRGKGASLLSKNVCTEKQKKGSTTELQTETRPKKTQLASDKYQVFLDTFDVKFCGHIRFA